MKLLAFFLLDVLKLRMSEEKTFGLRSLRSWLPCLCQRAFVQGCSLFHGVLVAITLCCLGRERWVVEYQVVVEWIMEM